MALLKLISANMVVAQMICFFLILWLLKKFLWKPIFQTLEDRRAKIDGEFKAIEATKADVAKLRSEYEVFLAKVDELTLKRIKEAEAVGEEKSQAIREKARQEAERIVEDARKEIQFEFAKNRDVLKTEIVEMVIKVTEQMIQEKLTYENDRKIIEGMLSEMEKADER
jgi:F-type H+-transporting ATPase subunit b